MNDVELAIAELLPDLFEPMNRGGDAADAHGDDIIPEGRRNSTLARLAGRLRRVGLSGDTISAALHAENQRRCVPALSYSEVEQVAHSIARYAPDAAVTPKAVVAAETIRFTTAAQVAQSAPQTVPWIVPGFVAPGVVTEVDGKLKASGKTTFFGQLVKAVLTGTAFLSRPTRRTAVLWLTEERRPTFVETLKRAGLVDNEDLQLLFWHDVRSLPWDVVMATAVAHAATINAGLLIVDTIGQWAGLRGDAENSNGDQLAAAEPLQAAAAAGFAVVVGRHERKGGGDVGESGRGGSAFSGAVDIVMSIRRGEGRTKPTVRVLHTLSRFTETPETLAIDLTAEGYVALASDATVAVTLAEDQILERLPDTEVAAMTLDMVQGEDITRTVAQEAIERLTEAGLVRRLGAGKKGNPFRWFRTAEDAAATQTS